MIWSDWIIVFDSIGSLLDSLFWENCSLIPFSSIFTGKNSSLLQEICLLSGSLSEVSTELNCMVYYYYYYYYYCCCCYYYHYYLLLLLLLLRIHFLLLFVLLTFIIIILSLLLLLLLLLSLFRILHCTQLSKMKKGKKLH